MTLGDMRDNGVRSLFVSCWNCHHRAVLSADHWPDDAPVPMFGRAWRARAAASEQPARESLTGVQWR
jgi:hypothetical protein